MDVLTILLPILYIYQISLLAELETFIDSKRETVNDPLSLVLIINSYNLTALWLLLGIDMHIQNTDLCSVNFLLFKKV